ncbi:MAG TPA: glycosyl transferase, partial [Acidimicrobiia bacterium]
LAGPAAYTLTTVLHPASGPVASAGPTTSSTGFGPGGASTSADAALLAYLEAHRGSAKYLVAAFGSQSSASIIIASGQPVITIGGFNGADPAPTLAQFERLVAEGQVRFVLVTNGGGPGGGFGPGGASGSGSAISQWVTTHGKEVSTTSSGTGSGTLYDVSGA